MSGDWRDRAACRDYDPETWFPTKTESDAGWEAAAKRVCRDKCWVQAECLAFALDMDATGIWAGMTKTERDRRRKVTPMTDAMTRDLEDARVRGANDD